MDECPTNISNPLNVRKDLESRNDPNITPIPPEAQADDLFDDSRPAPSDRPSPPPDPRPQK